jgi:osmotically-inducible protein OsmY
MKLSSALLISELLLAAVAFTGCARVSAKSSDVAGDIRASLDQFGYKDVSISQDRVRSVVTLTGRVSAEADREEAESIVRSMTAGQIISDEIQVKPAGIVGAGNTESADLDKRIAKNVDAALTENKVKKNVSYAVKSGVVTLKGSVNSQIRRARVEEIASGIPNVKLVVNELRVNNARDGISKE